MIITLSGAPGSGKSTVAEILAKHFGLKRYYMGQIRRDKAKEHGLTLEEFNRLGETEGWTDKIVDDFQKKLGETEDNFLIEGRTSFFLIPNSIKIYLEVDLKVGAQRIFKQIQNSSQAQSQRNEGQPTSVEAMYESLKNRNESDVRRYQKYYGVNILRSSHYDIFLDTTNMNPSEVIETLIKKIEETNRERYGGNS
jgi:predicted cytidylate kinase